MNTDELKTALEKHKLWLEDDRVNFVLQRKISWRMADEKRGK